MVTCGTKLQLCQGPAEPEIECGGPASLAENGLLLADISAIFVQTKFEMEDICDDTGGGILTSVYHEYRAADVGESKNDCDCVAAVAKKISEDVYMAYRHTKKPRAGHRAVWRAAAWATWYGGRVPQERHFRRPADRTSGKARRIRPLAEEPENIPVHTQASWSSPPPHPEAFPTTWRRPPYRSGGEKRLHDELGRARQKIPLLCVHHGRWRFTQTSTDILNREIAT
jgi:hypothetical protein